MDAKELAKNLKNIGPTMAGKLVAAGVDSPEKLKQLGAKKAYLKVYASGDPYGDHNAAYLHAFEGAIRNCNWQDIPKKCKDEHKKLTQELQRKKRIK